MKVIHAAGPRMWGFHVVAISTWVALVFFAFPGNDFGRLGWLALTPFYLSLSRARSATSSFMVGLLFGFSGWLASTWWMSIAAQTMGGIAGWISWGITLALAISGALAYGLFGYLAWQIRFLAPQARPLAAAALLTLLVTLLPSVFPGNLAHTQYREPLIVQLAALGGAPLVHLLLAWVGFSIATAALCWSPNPRRSLRHLATALISLSAAAGGGHLLLQHWNARISAMPTVRVGLIQANVPIIRRGEPLNVPPDARGNDLFTTIALTDDLLARSGAVLRDAPHEGPQFVLWPELPLPFSTGSQPADFYAIDEFMRRHQTPLFTSEFFVPNEITPEGRVFNVVNMYTNDGTPTARYHKNNLIPFGEYVPLENRFPGLRNVFPTVHRYAPGDQIMIFEPVAGVRAGAAVCLEIIYSRFLARITNNGANLLLNPADDAYFGRSAGASVHLALATFGAVAFRLPVVRVSNSGYSTVIDPAGHFGDAGPKDLFTTAAFVEKAPLNDHPSRHDPHDVGIILCSVITLIGALATRSASGNTHPPRRQ